MTEVKGKLTKKGKSIRVVLPTKKGSADFPIPEKAKRFRDESFVEGQEVDVVLDEANRIVSVTIPGTQAVAPVITPPKPIKGSYASARSHIPLKTNVREKPKASPEFIGGAFINPYTFLPFDRKPFKDRKVGRIPPTPLSADETPDGANRLTGVMCLRLHTRTPLMTCQPELDPETMGSHKILKALTIGNDVIIPATGVRGALRSLLTIVTGGTLGYLDDTAYLVQGRDAKLGPAINTDRSGKIPQRVFLGEVLTPGNANRSGKIRLGETKLVRLSDLQRLLSRSQLDRSDRARPVWIELNERDEPVRAHDRLPHQNAWRLRLSGRPVGGRRIEENKKEGVFRATGKIIDVPAELWAAYLGRHAASEHSELRKGDLVWLEPSDAQGIIASATDIKSLQWARWGRTGEKLEKRIPPILHPDAWNKDGLVDEVTNLFGQVRDTKRTGTESKTLSFSARVRTENVVFPGAAKDCVRTVLAPMSMPHPGCLAFYRDSDNPDDISAEDDDLRGYKVYRTSTETGDEGPWNYAVQGVYDEGRLKLPPQQRVNQTVDLLPAEAKGKLRISFRGLTPRELALLVFCCELPWRLGGGKPLGLGACQVTVQHIFDENGATHQPAELLGGEDWRDRLVGDYQSRGKAWTASQQPVPMMRYPRAMKGNSRGGHGWFGIHARPRQVSAPDDGQKRAPGLAPIYISGPLVQQAEQAGETLDRVEPMISGQTLPYFDPEHWQTDLLFGYDLVAKTEHGRQNTVTEFEPIAEDASNRGNYDKHPNQSQNRESREQRKRDRG